MKQTSYYRAPLSFWSIVLIFLLSTTVLAQNTSGTIEVYDACEISIDKAQINCKVWFKEPDNRIQTAFADTNSLPVINEAFTSTDPVSELWLLDAGKQTRSQKKAFISQIADLTSTLKQSINSFEIHHIADKNSKQLLFAGTVRPKRQDVIDILEDDLDFDEHEENISAYLDKSLLTFRTKMQATDTERGVIYFITSNSYSQAELNEMGEKFGSLNSAEVRLMVIPFKTSKDTTAETRSNGKLEDLNYFLSGKTFDVADIKEIAKASPAIRSYLVNGGAVRIDYGNTCGTQSLIIGDAIGSTLNQTMQFPDCPEQLTSCEIDQRSEACLKEQYTNCQINPQQGICKSVLLEYCSIFENESGCAKRILNHCKINQSDKEFNCESRIKTYCQTNPSDTVTGCKEINIKQCKINPNGKGCAKKLFDYCDFNTSKSGCNSYVTNYCSDNQNIRGCSDILNKSCWNNKGSEGCAQRLFEECTTVPTLVGCNEILLEQCTENPSLPSCANVLLEFCDTNPNADGCSEKLTTQCFVDSDPARCDALLNNFCWTEKGDSRCQDRVLRMCTMDPEKSGCGLFLLDECGANSDFANCFSYATTHCDANAAHPLCQQRTKQIYIFIAVLSVLLIGILIAFYLLRRSKLIPPDEGVISLILEDTNAEGKNVATEFNITKKKTILGKSPGCNVQVNDASVSRIHAELNYDNGAFFVNDLNSLNGVFVDDVQISEKKPLKSGNILKLGNTQLKFVINAKV